LERIQLGKPYCPECSRPLDILHGDFVVDFAQMGYKCKNCNTEYEGNDRELLKDIKGEVRKNYDNYWDVYCKELDKNKKHK
jgi:hypothetical protein